MKLQHIRLRRVPGIEPPFSLGDLAPGINVIVGPNGSGKTSLCRAMRSVLWPGLDRNVGLEIETVWEDAGDSDLHAVLTGAKVSWQRGGRDIQPLLVPDQHLARCYTLGVRDLMQTERETDATLAKEIRREMAGGYDPDAVRKDRFPTRARRTGEIKAWSDAQKRCQDIENEFGVLFADEEKLEDFYLQKEESDTARRRLPRLELAIRLAGARVAFGAIEAQLGVLPAELEHYQGDENARLEDLESDLETARGEVQKLEEELATWKKTEEATGLVGKTLNEIDLNAWRTRSSGLRHTENALTEGRSDAAKATAERESTEKDLRGQASGVNMSPVATKDLDGWETLVEKLVRRRAELRGTEVQLATLGGGTEIKGGAELSQGATLLRDWLAAGETGIPTRAVWGALCGVALAAVALGLALQGSPPWLCVLLAIAGVALGVPALLGLLGPGVNERAGIRKKIEERDLRQPANWARSEILGLLAELERESAKLEINRERHALAIPLEKTKKDLDDEVQELETEHQQLVAKLGIDATSDLARTVLARRLATFRAAADRVSGAETAVAELEGNLNATLEQGNQFLAAFGYETASDAAALEANIQDLTDRRGTLVSAQTGISAAETAIGLARNRRSKSEQRIRDLYAKLQLAHGRREDFEKNLALHPEWSRLTRERNDQQVEIRNLEAQLQGAGESLSLSEEEAQQLHDGAEIAANSLEDIVRKIEAIEDRVREAREGTELTEAIEARESARYALEESRDRAVHAAAGCFLLGQVEAEHDQASRPAVLNRAMAYFSAFTRNQYELVEPRTDGEEFRALDTKTRVGLALSQLSDGTRIQLILAVRLAFALHAEGDLQLPLMLDEVLSTADPERFAAVADSLKILASDGRQIFYLTANPADAAHWSALGTASTQGPPKIIDLSAIREIEQAAIDPTTFAPPTTPVLPPPDGKDRAEYAHLLRVPPINFAAPVESLHLFHLLNDDLPALHKVMDTTRIDAVGPWVSFSATGRASGLIARELRNRISTRVRLARSVFDSRSIGRGRRVDRGVLEVAEGVTPPFLDKLTSIASDHGGDARALIEVLERGEDERTKRFRHENERKLAAYLEEDGFLDRRERLDTLNIRTRALDAVADDIRAGAMTTDECHGLVDWLLET